MKTTDSGILRLKFYVDSIKVIQNEKAVLFPILFVSGTAQWSEYNKPQRPRLDTSHEKGRKICS